MAQTRRYAPLSLLILAGAATAWAAQLTGVDLVSTMGPETTQRIRAAHAVVVGDRIVAQDLDIEMALDDRTATARSQEAIIIFAGEEPVVESEDALTQEEIIRYGDDFGELATRGDMLLLGRTEDVEAAFKDSGNLLTPRLLWSERHARYLLPDAFVQTAKLDESSTMEIRGLAASINSDFTEFTYFGSDDTPAAMTFTVAP